MLPQVFLTAQIELDGRGSLMAVYLWAGEGSAISHTSAAFLLGLRGFRSTPMHISLPRRARSPRSGVITHFVREGLAAEIDLVGPIAVSSPRRTLLDLAAMGHPRLEAALDQCLHDGLVDIARMWLMLEDPEVRGRRGVRRLRNLLIERTSDTAPTQSDLELMFKRIVRRGRFPQPARQHPIRLPSRVVHVDFAYPEANIAIETDGYNWHMDRAAFEEDRKRDAELQALGWKPLRFTWAQLRYEPEYVLEQLQIHLGRRRLAG